MPEPRVVTVLAFDFGLKHIGVARGQSVTGTASPLPPLRAQDGRLPARALQELLRVEAPDVLLVGLPLNMDDSPSPMAAEARAFAERLARASKLPVQLVDERLSSVEARERLRSAPGARRRSRTPQADHGEAAVVIAETYFASGAVEG